MFENLREVFTADFKRDAEYREFMREKLDCFKLNNKSEDVAQIVKRLNDYGFESNFELALVLGEEE